MALGFKRMIRMAMGIILVAIVAGFYYTDNVSADYVGPGNNTSGVATSCDSFVNGYQYLCGNPKGKDGGGASWHVYKVSQLNSKKLHYVGSILDYGGINVNNVRSSCAGAGWAAVYGWEGSVSKGNGNILTGPANRTGTISIAQYNSYNAMNWSTLQFRIANDNIPDNRRITLDAAKRLYSSYNGGKVLGGNVGYFCFGPKKFKGQASVYKGDKVSDGVPRSTTGYVDQKKEAKTLQIECTDEKNGCKVHFSLNLAQVGASGGKTWYKIFTKKMEDSELAGVTDKKYITASNSGARVFERTVSLKPGENICYAIYFNFNSLLPDNSTWARVCAKSVKPKTTTPTVPSSDLRFEGQARVYEGDKVDGSRPKSTTSYTDKREVRAKTLDLNCPMSGCRAHFSLDLKKIDGPDNSKDWYIFYRKDTSNSAGTQELCRGEVWFNSGSQVTNNCGNKVKFDINNGERRFGFDEDLKPGQIVCYTNKFGTRGGASTQTGGYYGWAKVCVRALSSVEPMLSIQVRNDTLNTEYNDSIYAKPGDYVSYRSIYKPLTQYAQSWKPGGMRVHIGSNVLVNDGCDENDDGSCEEINDNGNYVEDNDVDVGDENNDDLECDEGTGGDCNEPENYTNEYIDNDVNTFVSDESVFEEDPNDYGGDDDLSGGLNDYGDTDWGSVAYINVVNSGIMELTSLFNNEVKEILPEWNNAYVVRRISSENCTTPYVSEIHKYDVGDVNEKIESDSTSTIVLGSDVGCSLGKMAEINPDSSMGNMNANIWTTPSRVEVNVGGTTEASIADIYTDRIFDTADVFVPYNFRNETIEVGLKDDVVYAGENNKISYKIKTGPKYNEKIDDEYATISRNAKWRAEVCYNDGVEEKCVAGNEDSGNLNDKNVMEGDIRSSTTNVIIPDVPAGTNVQVKACVYPSTSGASDNWQDPEGDHQWSCSSKELVVAKRPSFQVWGGSMYSAGNVNVPVADKISTVGRVFGSWVELDIVSSGNVQGLASGAGLGYANSNDALNAIGNSGATMSGLGGGADSAYCLMSTLSFANYKCKGDGYRIVGGLDNLDISKRKQFMLIDGFSDEDDERYELDDHGDNDYTIDDEIKDFGSEEGQKLTKVIKSEGDITIGKNITYKNDGYINMESIPKIIINAKNIKINCSVTRIDAVLVADGDIDDCADSTNINSAGNSKQLVINGSVIAQTLTLNRTYGANTGRDSAVPAEVVNYDASSYLWKIQQSGMVKSGKLVETLIRELAPRY